jgi:hypothetical protein
MLFPVALFVWFTLGGLTIAAGAEDQAAEIIRRCGKPTIDDNTGHDRPRPIIVTRWIEYRKAAVRFMFIPDAKASAPPPYKGWKFVGAVDQHTNTQVSLDDGLRRAGCRK